MIHMGDPGGSVVSHCRGKSSVRIRIRIRIKIRKRIKSKIKIMSRIGRRRLFRLLFSLVRPGAAMPCLVLRSCLMLTNVDGRC